MTPTRYPMVLAPMAGGPSTPELAAAVCNAGGLGFLAAGYLSVEAVRAQVESLRALTSEPFGLNLFAAPAHPVAQSVVDAYRERIAHEADRLGVSLGAPRADDDHFAAKVALAIEARVPVVSFAFGCPSREVVERLHGGGCAVWVTITDASEAALVERCGADAVIAQGSEAGGHRGGFADVEGRPLKALLRELSTSLPVIAAGGISDVEAMRELLATGASAVQLGTAFMRCPEAGTSAVHRAALSGSAVTSVTRAFSGRLARGIENRFMREHSAFAPSAYPELHYLTAPLRAKGREVGDAEVVNLWAGVNFARAEALPAGELVRRWGAALRR